MRRGLRDLPRPGHVQPHRPGREGPGLQVAEALELALYPDLLSRALRASIRRRHPTEMVDGDMPWSHNHWSTVFQDLDSGLLHPFHALRDGWEKNLVISTRERFRSEHKGKTLQDLCIGVVKMYGPPYYVTVAEIISGLRSLHGGRDNWIIDVGDWPEWEGVGRDKGGKMRFVKWHGTTDWVPGAFTPPPGLPRNGKTKAELGPPPSPLARSTCLSSASVCW